jgi:hypothetical protein
MSQYRHHNDRPPATLLVSNLRRIPNTVWTWEATLILIDAQQHSPYVTLPRQRYEGVILQGSTEDELRADIADFMFTPVSIVMAPVAFAQEDMLRDVGQEVGHAD